MSEKRRNVIAQAHRENRETVSAYELCAEGYALSTRDEPSLIHSRMISAFVQRVRRGGHVLEIGSGPGWDADRLEDEGIRVHRTDVTQAFIEFQRRRGKRIVKLDLIEDSIQEAYNGILCLYVLQHIARPLVDGVLEKLSASLQPKGTLLAALRQGRGELREVSSSSGVCHITLWSQSEFTDRLLRAGLTVERSEIFVDSDGEWLVVLARKVSAPALLSFR
jgi:2-polyprenyl-3-methyl-5-hydroxy-6-metoxy-1,4-benzoquinol methylase